MNKVDLNSKTWWNVYFGIRNGKGHYLFHKKPSGLALGITIGETKYMLVQQFATLKECREYVERIQRVEKEYRNGNRKEPA